MTFEQLSLFLAAADSDTFFDAAETMHTTQSNLSKQMKKMEQELEVTLWDRSRRSAVLTPAGQVFYKDAAALAAAYEQALANLNQFRRQHAHRLHLGSLPILSQYQLTAPVNRFIRLHPEFSVTLTEAEETELLQGLENGTFDLVFAREAMIDQNRFQFSPIASDRLCAILPAGHPLAARQALSLSEIAREPLILMHPYTAIHRQCMELFQTAGLTPSILRTARAESIISAVQTGEGISLLPESSFRLFAHTGILSRPVADIPPLLVGIAQKSSGNPSPAAAVFLSSFKSFMDAGKSRGSAVPKAASQLP